jgi:putative glutathione S-transferase
MGMLIDGEWHDRGYDTASNGGKFKREQSRFRHWVTVDGRAGPSGESGFKAEPGRYHLYVSYACPWAHRTLIFRSLKKLEQMISVSVVHWHMGEHGWTFEPASGVIPDAILGANYLYEVYLAADPDYTGRVVVPTLWDRKQQTIVNNESSEIIRMFNSAFDDIGAAEGDYYPAAKRPEIDAVNERVYHTVNNGVYKAGFATSQDAYEQAFEELFASLEWLDDRLSRQRYLAGSELTEADWRLFTTLIRFDAVYFGHFKCNLKRIVDYPNLWAYVCDLYQHPGIAATVHLDHIKSHYYTSHKDINPNGIVPRGPAICFDDDHDRSRLSA